MYISKENDLVSVGRRNLMCLGIFVLIMSVCWMTSSPTMSDDSPRARLKVRATRLLF